MTSTSLSVTDRLLHQRILVLARPVDDETAAATCSQLLLLAAEDSGRDITLVLSAPGGSASAALAVHDVLRLVPNDVATLAVGPVAGPGALLLAAGAPGKRYALPHVRVLLHGGATPAGAGLRGATSGLDGDDGVVLRLTAEHAGQPVADRDARSGRWWSAEEARGHGLVDHVLTGTAALGTARGGTAFDLAGARG